MGGILGRQGAGGLQDVEDARLRSDHAGVTERLGLPVVGAREQVAGDAPPEQPMERAVAPRAGWFAVVLDDDGDTPVERKAQAGQQRDEPEAVHVHHIGLQIPNRAHERTITRLEPVHDAVAFDLRRARCRSEAGGDVDRVGCRERVERHRHRRHRGEGLGRCRLEDRRHHDDDPQPSRFVHEASRVPRPRATRSTVAPKDRRWVGHTICSTTWMRSRGPIANA